jgi:60 kDa SS-A/Ro ribonucleoprotein
MANASLFNTRVGTLPKADTRNQAGGLAYKMSDKEALSQLAVTGCLSNTFYASAESQLKETLDLAFKVEPEFLAKTAIYARNEGLMKDMPALLATVLAVRDSALFEKVAPQIIDNGRMIRNLVQMIRSSQIGDTKNLPRPVRRFITNWIVNRKYDRLFSESVGNNPSMADVIKMVHPKPKTTEQAAFFGYLLDRKYEQNDLPEIVKQYELFKQGKTQTVPAVEFRMLDSLGLTTAQWSKVALNMGWQALRMNLNTLNRHGVFNDRSVVTKVADRLRDEKEIRRSRVMPYQLLTAYLNTKDNLPSRLSLALQDAMEIAVDNVLVLDGDVVVCPDVSGSMGSSVTGHAAGRNASKARCIDVAALVTAAVLRKNPEAQLVPYAHTLYPKFKLNPRDSIMTNAEKLIRLNGGGTNSSLPLKFLNENKMKADVVLYVSDNQSWLDSGGWGYDTASTAEWKTFKGRNKGAKLILNDIQPYTNTQVKESQDVFNVGGFSDAVFKFLAIISDKKTKNSWITLINQVSLEAS